MLITGKQKHSSRKQVSQGRWVCVQTELGCHCVGKALGTWCPCWESMRTSLQGMSQLSLCVSAEGTGYAQPDAAGTMIRVASFCWTQWISVHTLTHVAPEYCKVASLLGLQACLRGVSIVERVGRQQSWLGLRHTLGVSAKLTLGQGLKKVPCWREVCFAGTQQCMNRLSGEADAKEKSTLQKVDG